MNNFGIMKKCRCEFSECNENIDEGEMIFNVTSNGYEMHVGLVQNT